MATLKVLMLAPTPFFSDRGCHVRILNETEALLRFGHAVRIATYHIGGEVPGIPTHRIPLIPWYRKLSAGPSLHKPYLDLLLSVTSSRLASKFRPDVVHAHLHEGGFIGARLKKRFKVPMVLDLQSLLPEELVRHDFIKPGSAADSLGHGIEARCLRLADSIITSTSNLKSALVEAHGIDPEAVIVLEDCVDTSHFRPMSRNLSLVSRLGIPPENKIAVFVGLLNEYQGLPVLLKAIRHVCDSTDRISFIIMGYPGAERYRKVAEQLGIDGNVVFTGRVSYLQLPQYLSLGDVGISPKGDTTEGNHKVLLYMAMGIPVVAFDTPTNRELLGDAGSYAPLGDHVEFADRILDVCFANRDGEDTDWTAHKLREQICRRYSCAEIGGKLTQVYEAARP